MGELRECPFCGSQRVMIGRTAVHKFRVTCIDCGVTTAWSSEQYVVACWNQRAADAEIEALEEKLEKALTKARGGVACSR